MIYYTPGRFQILFMFRLRGSVFPKAFVLAAVSMGLALASRATDVFGIEKSLLDNRIYTAFSFALGFLLVFRNSQAYSRFWEGARLLRLASKEWYDACAQAIAFVSTSDKHRHEVQHFRHMSCRLFSLLMASSLQECSSLTDDVFEVLDLKGFDEFSLEALQSFRHQPKQRKELALQWILNFFCDSMKSRVLAVPGPVMSRLFAELSNGNLNFEKVVTIGKTPFPFPYAQMITALLLIHLIYTAMIVSALVSSPIWICLLCFISVFTFWCINYIASEIEAPFGEDLNDLPVRELMVEFNNSLLLLLDQRGNHLPGVHSVRRTETVVLTADHLDTMHSLNVELERTETACSLVNKDFDDEASSDARSNASLEKKEDCPNHSLDPPALAECVVQENQNRKAGLIPPAELGGEPEQSLTSEQRPEQHVKQQQQQQRSLEMGEVGPSVRPWWAEEEDEEETEPQGALEGRLRDAKDVPSELINEHLLRELSKLSSIGARLVKWIDGHITAETIITQASSARRRRLEQESPGRVWQV